MTFARMDLFVTVNRIEAALWTAIGLAFFLAALRRDMRRRGACVIAATAFAAFGVSDLVEATTGAWWRPWWLLVWKGVCLAVLLALLVGYVRRRKVPSETSRRLFE